MTNEHIPEPPRDGLDALHDSYNQIANGARGDLEAAYPTSSDDTDPRAVMESLGVPSEDGGPEQYGNFGEISPATSSDDLKSPLASGEWPLVEYPPRVLDIQRSPLLNPQQSESADAAQTAERVADAPTEIIGDLHPEKDGRGFLADGPDEDVSNYGGGHTIRAHKAPRTTRERIIRWSIIAGASGTLALAAAAAVDYFSQR